MFYLYYFITKQLKMNERAEHIHNKTTNKEYLVSKRTLLKFDFTHFYYCLNIVRRSFLFTLKAFNNIMRIIYLPLGRNHET